MPPCEFEFDLHAAKTDDAGALADAVAVAVIRYAGYTGGAARELASEIGAAVRDVCTGGVGCDVHFHAGSGELEVVVSAGTHATRRVVRAIPA